MLFDPKQWRREFSETTIAKGLPCARCQKKKLEIVKDSLKFGQTRGSVDLWNEYGGVPFSTYRFTCLLKCRQCNEIIIVAGYREEHEDVDVDYPEEPAELVTYVTLKPKFIEPAPQLFSINKKCPDDVRKALEDAFSLYWFDLNACVSRLRTAVEFLLDSVGIEGIRTKEDGTKVPIELGKRIEELKKSNEPFAKFLEAVKWLGNVSTHRLGLKVDDVNKALRIISFALVQLYEGEIIGKIVDDINIKKGP